MVFHEATLQPNYNGADLTSSKQAPRSQPDSDCLKTKKHHPRKAGMALSF